MAASQTGIDPARAQARQIVSRCMATGSIDNSAKQSLTNDAVGIECFFIAADRLQSAPGQKRNILLDLIYLCFEEEDFFRQAVIANADGNRKEAGRCFERYLKAPEISKCTPETAGNWKWMFDRLLDPSQFDSCAAGKPAVFQFWDKSIPADVAAKQQEWKQIAAPGQYRLFNDEEARELVGGQFGANATKLFDKCWAASIKSDLFRYAVLYGFGGIYIDSDLAPQPEAREYLPNFAGRNVIWGRSNFASMHLATGLMSGVPKWGPFADSMEMSLFNLKHHIDWNPLKLAGPFVLTKVLRHTGPPRSDFGILSNAFVRKKICRGFQPAYKKTPAHWEVAYTDRQKGNRRN